MQASKLQDNFSVTRRRHHMREIIIYQQDSSPAITDYKVIIERPTLPTHILDTLATC